MGLLDVLASIPRAITEKAQADEFGRDWKERRQRAADVHNQSELENALSNVNLDTKVRGEAARMRALMGDKYTDPVEAEAAQLSGDRTYLERKREADLRTAGANASFLEQKPDLMMAALDSREHTAAELLAFKEKALASGDAYHAAIIDSRLQALNQRDRQAHEMTGRDEGSPFPMMNPSTGEILGAWYPRTNRYVPASSRGPAPGGPAAGTAPAGGGPPSAPILPAGAELRRSPLPAKTVEEVAGIDTLLGNIKEVEAALGDPNTEENFGGPFGVKSRITGLGVSAGLVDDPKTVRLRSLISKIGPKEAFATGGKQLTGKEWELISPYLSQLNIPTPVLKENLRIAREGLEQARNARVGGSMTPQPYPGADPEEGKTATGPGGAKLIKRNGQWVPLQ